MDELACFAPGMIALGSSGYDSEEAKKFLTLAEEVKKVSTIFPYGMMRSACFQIFDTLSELLINLDEHKPIC